MRVLAEIIASDGNHPIEPVLWDSLLPSDCPGSVHQLRDEGDQERHKRPLVSSLSGNVQRFGMDKVHKLESLQEIIARWIKIRLGGLPANREMR